MTVVALVWLAGFWVLILVGIGLAATIPLMKRREPDPPDDPAAHGLPADAVTFASRDGLALGGWWIPAPTPARGTVIMCPGQNGSLDKDVPQAVPLHRAGFNVLMFDFRAHSRSEGETVTLGALEQADLFGALDYVQGTHGIDRVGVVGFSMGAGVALLVAAQDERVAALVVDGAFPRLEGLLTSYLRLRGLPRWLARLGARWVLLMASLRTGYQLYRANPIDLADRITCPALFIHGEDDPFVPGDDLTALVGRLTGPVEIWRVTGAGHREAYAQHPDDYDQRLCAWFTRHLAPDEGAA